MRVLWHIILLAITATVAGMGGLSNAAIAAAGAGAACIAVCAMGAHLVRVLAFLGGVAVVVSVGLKIEEQGVFVLTYGVLLAVQLGALASALTADPDKNDTAALPTLAFYAALGTAFLLIGGQPEGLSAWLRIVAAASVVAAGLVAWRSASAVQRFRRAEPKKKSGRVPEALLHFAGFAAVLLVVGALLYKPLPWASQQVIAAGAGVRTFASEMVERWKGGGEAERPDGRSAESVGPSDMDFGRRRELPRRADLELGGEAMVHVRIPDKAQFERFVSSRNYLRHWVLERFTETGWEEPDSEGAYLEDRADGRDDGWIRLRPGKGIVHRVFLPDAGGAGLPAIQNPLAYRLSFLVESAPDMYEAELRGAVYFDAESAPLTLDEVGSDQVRPGRALRSHLMAPAAGDQGRRLTSTAKQIFADARGSGERLAAIRDYLQENCEYRLQIENPQGLSPIENFLYGERVGWCDFFASAAVLLAREAGFPARMAYGFSGGTAYGEAQVVSYRESDAHAWAEVYVDGVGWVVFDTTPAGSGAAMPPRAAESGAAPDLTAYRAAEADRPSAQVETSKRPVPAWARWGLGLAALALVALIALRIVKKGEDEDRERRETREDRGERGAPGYLREFLRLCSEAGRPKPRGETLRETIVGLAAVGLSGGVLPTLVEYHYAVQYEEAPRDRAREGEFRKELRRLRKTAS